MKHHASEDGYDGYCGTSYAAKLLRVNVYFDDLAF